MKKILFIFIFFIVNIYAQSNFQFEVQNLITDNDVSTSLDVHLGHNFKNSKFGTFGWFLVGKYWAEAYGGLSYAIAPWCVVELGYGIEQADNAWRVGGSLWAMKENFSLLLILEDGGGSFWHRGVLNYRLNKIFGIGLMSEEFLGIGPRAEINLSNLPLQIWASYLIKDSNKNLYLSLKFLF